MMLGLGLDLAEIERYRFDDATRARFARRIYTEYEMAYAARTRRWAERLAGIFAAKEATRKALGHAVPWREIEVRHDAFGKPEIVTSGVARAAFLKRGVRVAHCTITHTETTAAAVVILER